MSSGPIRIELRGLGHVPCFKNAQRVAINKHTGLPMKVTLKAHRQWMQRAARAIEFQLRSALATTESETTSTCSRPSKTAWSLLDDRWQVLEIGSVRTILVPPGEEGADIILERIP